MIYAPREDSLLLAKIVKNYAKNKQVLDLGTGSGFLAKTALNAGAKSVLAADINPKAVEQAKTKGIKSVQSDLFSNIKGSFDIIVFNPPYLPLDVREDKESRKITTGGRLGDEIILKFLAQAPSHLDKKGIILIILSSLTPKKRIKALLKKKFLKFRIVSSEHYFMETLEVWKIQESKGIASDLKN